MIPYHNIAGRFFNRPLLLTPQATVTVSRFLLSRMNAKAGHSGAGEMPIEELQVFGSTEGPDGSRKIHSPRASRFVGEYRNGPDGPLPYRTTHDGTAIITLVGELVHRGGWVGASSGVISYEGIKYQLITAAHDPLVTAIVLDIESPGGEATGCFETTALLREIAQIKPVFTVVNGMAASAAYGLASASTRIFTIPSGDSGSVGVWTMHLDISKWLEDVGMKPTLVWEGAHKVDGNPFEALPDSVRADIQAEIRQCYDLFVESVAAGRTNMTADAIRGTEARMYMGEAARGVGLVDEVAAFEDVIATLADPRSRALLVGTTKSVVAQQTKETSMKKTVKPGASMAAGVNAAEDEACPTCHKDGCSCGDKCTAENCGCCPADGGKEEEASAASASAAGQSSGTAVAGQPVANAIADENRKLRDENAALRRQSVEAGARSLLEKAARELKVPGLPAAKDAQAGADGQPAAKAPETLATVLYESIVSGKLNDGCATCKANATRAESIVGLLPAAPQGRLPVKPGTGAAAFITGAAVTAGDQGEMHQAIVTKLTADGLKPGSRKWNAAYAKTHSEFLTAAATPA